MYSFGLFLLNYICTQGPRVSVLLLLLLIYYILNVFICTSNSYSPISFPIAQFTFRSNDKPRILLSCISSISVLSSREPANNWTQINRQEMKAKCTQLQILFTNKCKENKMRISLMRLRAKLEFCFFPSRMKRDTFVVWRWKSYGNNEIMCNEERKKKRWEITKQIGKQARSDYILWKCKEWTSRNILLLL